MHFTISPEHLKPIRAQCVRSVWQMTHTLQPKRNWYNSLLFFVYLNLLSLHMFKYYTASSSALHPRNGPLYCRPGDPRSQHVFRSMNHVCVQGVWRHWLTRRKTHVKKNVQTPHRQVGDLSVWSLYQAAPPPGHRWLLTTAPPWTTCPEMRMSSDPLCFTPLDWLEVRR